MARQEAIAQETQGGGVNVVELQEITVTPEPEPEPEKTEEPVSAAAPEGQAAEAGARPAPDDSAGASPVAIRPYRHSPDGLMECVLSVVNGLLDELESRSSAKLAYHAIDTK